jgi:acylphosphatase
MSGAGAHIVVTGRVQGVGFRDFAARTGRQLGLAGSVRNLRDGDVVVHVEGERPVIESFIERLKQGPPGARVSAVHVDWQPATGRHDSFVIEF